MNRFQFTDTNAGKDIASTTPLFLSEKEMGVQRSFTKGLWLREIEKLTCPDSWYSVLTVILTLILLVTS